MSQTKCEEHDRLLEYASQDSDKKGCFLCVSYGDLRGERVEKIMTKGDDDCVPSWTRLEKMSCEPPFHVKVLSISSPACISLRPVLWEEAAFEMEMHLSDFYNSLPTGGLGTLTNIAAGTVCVIKWDNKWRRAVVVSRREEEVDLVDNVTIRLVDFGTIVTTDVVNLLPLASRFLSCPALCIIGHLHGLQHWDEKDWLEEELVKMKNLLPEDFPPVTLTRRGAPKKDVDGGYYSMPVDLIWEEVDMPDPFMPEVVTEFSFTKLISTKFSLTSTMGDLDDTVEVDELDEFNNADFDKEFSHVHPLDDSSGFRWLDPELPLEDQFTARGTFVDDSGQIYMQLHSSRRTVRVLRQLLNEKFSESEPDLGKTLSPLQECCAKWRDGNWYRARFIKYIDSEHQRGCVVLVDFGNMYQVGVESIRCQIYGQRIPIQCLRAVLTGVEPVGGAWSQECLDHIQHKINYAKVEGNDKLWVKIVGKSGCLPLEVCVYEKSEQGVVVELSTILTLLFPRDVRAVKTLHPLPDPLCVLNKSLSWDCVSPGHYKQHNPYLLLCPQYREEVQDEIPTIPSLDWDMAGLRQGEVFQVKIGGIVGYNQVYVMLEKPGDPYLSLLASQHKELAEGIQDKCDRKPPVLQPRPGLPVAVKWADEGWFRGVIRDYSDDGVFVEYVDDGTRDWVWDSMLIKEMPEEWINLPSLAIPVQLKIKAVETDLDVVISLMMECLNTWEKNVWVKMVKVEEEGRLVGHLVNSKNEVLYKGLIKEGVVKIEE